ncbi:hypothetical protein WN943_019909 [Citrus x changshan-huyou]
MAEKQLEILRGYELRLLRCTLAPPPSDLRIQSQPLNEESQCSLLPLHEHINSLIDSIESGHYLQALSSDAAKLVLDTLDFVDLNDSADRADRVYSALLQRVEAFIVNDSENDVDKACRVILLMCLSIAALFWFTQCNVTGPSVHNLLKCRFPLEVSTLEGNELIEWENWARYQLMSVGSDLLGKFSYLQYIVFAKMLLIKTKDLLFDATALPVNGIRTISWWLTRLLLMHQRILDERSSSLYDLLKVFMDETLQHFGTLENVEPKAQMVLVANTSSSNTSDACPSISQVIHTHDSTIGDATDVFVTPKLLGNSHESETEVQCIHAGGSAAHLKAIQQALTYLYVNQRSLARSAYNRGEYETSKILWEAAMALNSLYPDGWFALGAAALKAYDQEEEQRGFYSIQGGPKVQVLRNSWQLWENYSHVALDVGNIGQALEAVQMVLNMTNNKRIDTELLERIVLDLEGRTSIIESESCRTTHNLNRTNNTCAKDLPVESVYVSSPEESIMGRSRENEHLMEFLGKILQQGSDMWKDRDRFKRFSYASLELCKVYMEISSSSGSRRELFAAEMHLKNIPGLCNISSYCSGDLKQD